MVFLQYNFPHFHEKSAYGSDDRSKANGYITPFPQWVEGNTVLVVVADYLATPLAAELSQFQTDLTSEGCNVVVQNMSGGTAADLKTLLQGTAVRMV